MLVLVLVIVLVIVIGHSLSSRKNRYAKNRKENAKDHKAFKSRTNERPVGVLVFEIPARIILFLYRLLGGKKGPTGLGS